MTSSTLQRWGFRAGLLTATVIATGLGLAGEAAAKKLKHPPTAPVVQPAVPLPRLSPSTAPAAAAASGNATAAAPDPTDSIGALISDDIDPEQAAREDSDAPEAAPAPSDTARASLPAPDKTLNPVGLKLALRLLDNNDATGATLAAYALPDRLDVKIVNWMIATGSFTGIPSATLATLDRQLAGWPSQTLMRTRYEQALAREQAPPQQVIQAFTSKPVSDEGTVLLASAYRAVGRKDDAAALIRGYWRDEDFPTSIEQKIVQNFADVLTPADHAARMDRLLYKGDAAGALRVAKLLNRDQQALAKAVTLAIKGSPKATAALAALPASVRNDPIALFSRIQTLRRQNKSAEAGRLILSAPRDPRVLIDPDAWWVERRLVSRQLIDAGDPRTAYAIAAGHAAESPTMQAEAEFHAGWYALEYLHEPGKAQVHFAAIAAISKMPLSASRAEYWLGRTAEAAGDPANAKAHYQRAAAYPTTFYGELALARLGSKRLPISQAPTPTGQAIQTFQGRDFVQVIRHLTAAGYGDRATPFYKTLADQLNDPGELALLAGMADDSGNHQLALQIGKSAAVRGLPVEALAFPTTAIPASAKTPSVERPVVFAIARQESAFNPQAVSGAGALGLLQLMPSTAKQVAKAVGVPYSKARLTSDPGYNAQLGAAHLGDLVDTFGGSYVMTFAAYNAGATRGAQWVKQFGDPRDPKVDVVNWIERIPFTETRNYVQRIMENLQVYRARLGQPLLTIEADLRRGAAASQ
jgi:soluble lytic murein transglycosylase